MVDRFILKSKAAVYLLVSSAKYRLTGILRSIKKMGTH